MSGVLMYTTMSDLIKKCYFITDRRFLYLTGIMQNLNFDRVHVGTSMPTVTPDWTEADTKFAKSMISLSIDGKMTYRDI